ncbi:Mariner Mos1 transposase [Anthophora plagiata]
MRATFSSYKQRFLYRIITRDKKWCLYANMRQRKKWVAPGDTPKSRVKQDLYPKKIMICVWWNCEGMVYWVLLEKNSTMVNKELCIAQLYLVNEAILLKKTQFKMNN